MKNWYSLKKCHFEYISDNLAENNHIGTTTSNSRDYLIRSCQEPISYDNVN